MDTIHIVYIITKLELGGAQKICLTLNHDITSDRHSSTLIAGAGGLLDNHVKHLSNTTLLHTLQRELRLSGIWHEIRTFIHLVKILRKLRKQHKQIIVHTHSTKAGIIGRWAAFFARIPLRVHTIHGYAFHDHQNSLHWLCIYLIELITTIITTHFICVSSADITTGKKLFPRFTQRYTLIRAAIPWNSSYTNREHSAMKAAHAQQFIMGTIACFKPQKNIFDLLRVFDCISKKNPYARCEIIGDGALRPDIEAWIQHHNLTDRITLHGWQHDVLTLMQQWDAFVLTSLWEGLPCSIIEARMLSIPVFSYATGGISDVITSNVNGMLYTPGDWQTLACDLYRFSTDTLWQHQLRAHQDNLHDFEQEVMVEQHRALYNRLVQHNSSY